MRLNRIRLFLALAFTAALLGGNGTVISKEPGTALEMARQLNQAFIEVAEQVSPAVVVIQVAHKSSLSDSSIDEDSPFWDFVPRQFRKQLEEQQQQQREKQSRQERDRPPVEPEFDSQGSGVVIREEGYILTNRHVVDGADKIEVRFKDDSGAWYPAVVRGVDSQSDLAVLKIDPKGKKLTVAKLADSNKTRVGEFAIAIGAPFLLDYSVTFGHVSAKGRSHIIDNAPAMDQDFIQTDANINPGNSGGPLVNIDGEVMGINTLIRGLHTGIGFAIPANLVREVADKLVSDGKYVRSYLGIEIRTLRDYPEYREMITGIKDGVVVKTIQPGGPASRSDLHAGDVITSVDSKAVATSEQLKSEVRSKKVGQPVSLDVYRNGKNLKVKVKTDAWPDDTLQIANKPGPLPEDASRDFGLTVKPLTKDLADQFGVEKTEGVIVTEVAAGSPGAAKRLQPGDIITEVNQKPVNTIKQFRDAIKAADPKKGVVINFTTHGTSKFEILKESGE